VERPEQEGRDAEPLRRAGRTLADGGFFDRFGGRWRSARALAREHAAPGASKKARDQARALLDLAEIARRDAELRDDEAIRTVVGPHLRGAATDIEGLRAVHRWRREVERAFAGLNERPVRRALLEARPEDLADIAAFLGSDLHTAARASAGLSLGASRENDLWRALAEAVADPPWREPLMLAASPDAVGGLLSGLKSLVDANAELVAAETYAVETLKLDLEDWFGGPRAELSPAVVGRRAEEALHAPGALQPWLGYDRARAKVKGWGAEAVLARLETGEVGRREAALAWRLAWASAAAKAVLKARPVLLEQDGATLKNLRTAYARLDEEVMMLRRRRIAARLMERRPPKGAQSARGEGEDRAYPARARGGAGAAATCGARGDGPRRARPAGDQALLHDGARCRWPSTWSPAGCSSTWWSWTRPARCAPRTPSARWPAAANWWWWATTSSCRPPPSSTAWAATRRRWRTRGRRRARPSPRSSAWRPAPSAVRAGPMLQWHYRSKHPELIAFSNAWFYKGELVVFPAPTETDAELGLELVPVPDGTAEQGVNDVEARRIAEAAVAHLSAHPGRSLGVVAMNIRQAERIDAYVNELRKSNPEAAAALDRGEDDANRIEPFFVKNLENVQGDERDVMMVSMTYGPREPGGKVPQNFGPINRDGGHRRLNVLFSRAKERMVIFSSMRSTDVTPGEDGSEGVRALRDFLQYAETKRLPSGERITGRAPESPFEEAVASALERAGYAVEPQLGVESFRIDLAVRDPVRPKAFLLGIECDGASYHSSLSARDRDRLRQEILERLGWEIERVWSVDWYRDPQAQVDRILKRLESLRAPLKPAAPVVENALPDAVAAKLNGGSAPAPGRTGALTREEARAALVALREKIERDFPDTDPSSAFLRPRLLDELLRRKPADLQQWGEVIPEELRSGTNRDEFRAYREEVFGILSATG
jgi:very-short-patch-repair endonuclease